jgi:hypothetical protein
MTLPSNLMGCSLRSGARPDDIEGLVHGIGRALPPDYQAFLLASDGFEGTTSAGAYVSLWAAGEVAELNEDYATSEFAPGVTLIGTDGANTGYGFVFEEGRYEYVSVPLLGMEPSEVRRMGERLDDLLKRIADGDNPAPA